MQTAAVDTCWGKSLAGGSQSLSVTQHLADAAAVAAVLWESWLPHAVRRRISEDLAEPVSGAVLVCLLAGLHDLGKVSPAFASKVPALLPPMRSAGLVVSDTVPGRQWLLPHALAGAHALRAWLIEARWPLQSANALAAVVGGHHGAPPPTLATPPPRDLLGDASWDSARRDLIERTITQLNAGRWLDGWSQRPPSQAASVLISAVVIVADWLASDTELFPYSVIGTSEQRAATAWGALALPKPWRPEPPDTDDNDFWSSRFAFPAAVGPRPVQTAVTNLLHEAANPRLLLVEAPMGEGKTEAALAAAEVLAARHGCGGVLVALPTMATSDAMFARVLAWLDRLPATADGGALSTCLAHGKARLNETYRGVQERGLEGIGDDEGGVPLAHAWLSGRKKGVLSSFVVGTIDQVLVGALRTRHLALRHLGLAAKVVILDEVHAADDYMSVYLDRVLEWLGAYGVPVVLLSATLPPARRRELLAAYQSGQGVPPAVMVRRRKYDQAPPPTTAAEEPAGYPLLTIVDGTDVRHMTTAASGRGSEVTVDCLDEDKLAATLASELRDGGTLAIVCNTVTRAQRLARDLRAVFAGDVLLVHSRFLAEDRAALEDRVRRLLGPPGTVARPDRLVLVGTQVLEQSLDIDVDLMVTDLAPIDLVLQRLGRLHRHRREQAARPLGLRAPRLLVSGVEDWKAAPPRALRGSRSVYGEAALLRSATVLRPHLQGRPLRLPDDIAALVRDGYAPYDPSDATWPPELEAAQAEAGRQRVARQARAADFRLRPPGAEQQSLLGWLDGGADEETAQGQAAVRDGLQGVEVLLLEEREGRLHLPEWVTEGSQPLDGVPPERSALAALGCSVRLPDWCTDAALGADLSGPSSWAGSRWLRDVLVLPARGDCGGLHAELAHYRLSYDRQEGLTVTTTEGHR